MKTMRNGLTGLALVFAAASQGWGADSAMVYSSGPLILGFLGLCALVVLAQFTPMVMLVVGLVKGVAELFTKGRKVPQTERDG